MDYIVSLYKVYLSNNPDLVPFISPDDLPLFIIVSLFSLFFGFFLGRITAGSTKKDSDSRD